MPTPTQLELEAQLKNVAKIVNEERKFGSANAANFVGMEDSLLQSIESDYADQILASVRASRSALAASIISAAGALDSNMRDWGRFIRSDHADGSLQLLLSDIYRFWRDNAITILRRNPTFAAMVAGGANAGDGVLRRLTINKDNFVIENMTAEKKLARCLSDHNSGTDKGKERFRLAGEPTGRDILENRGSGEAAVIELTAQHSSFSLIRNSSFDILDGASVSVLTSIPNWTVGAIANFELDNSNVALPAPNDNVIVRGLRIKANETLTQKLANIRQSLNPALPFTLALWFNKTPGAVTAGTLTIRMGSRSKSVDLATAAANWNRLEMDITQDLWFERFNEQDLDIQIQVTGLVGTFLLVDDATFVPWTAHDGTWWLLLPGRTPFRVEDIFTGTDTIPSDSVIQRTIVFRYGRFLPHAAVPSIADPV